jgi:multiple sugar transport system substrate-binding protein
MPSDPYVVHLQTGRRKTDRISLIIGIFLLVACKPAIFDPPRLASPTEQGVVSLTSTAEPLFVPAPTATSSPAIAEEQRPVAQPLPSLTVWINETSQEHAQALAEMMEELEQEQQISAELILVSSALLPGLMETAVVSDSLPDLVLHPVAFTLGWTARGILDADAADQIVDQIGRRTFDPEALELVSIDGLTAAIPSDGYQQLLLYRTDWLEARGLLPPDNFEAMLTMAEAIFDPAAVISGIVVPTEANLITTQQAFEHIAAANGCQLIDDSGEVLIRDPACQEALDFYLNLIGQYSPIGVQTDASALNAYMAGRTGMIMSSPGILPKLAGLDAARPATCPECLVDSTFLAENSGIITRLLGRDAGLIGANFGEVIYLGVTRTADRAAAAAFAEYWFNAGYNRWLAIEQERKVPMRWGTSAQPRQFIDNWGKQPLNGSGPTLADLFGEAAVEQLASGIADSRRWGLRQGQGVLMTELYETDTLPVVLQEMLSGYFNSGQTLLEMYTRVTDLIPNYAFYSQDDSPGSP